MIFDVIASGSKGNATIVKYKNSVILIDFGTSIERLVEGLNELHLTMDDIDGAIFTHDHGDHIKSIKALSPKKMYSLAKTLPSLSNVVEPFKEFKIKDFTILPFPTSHDAKNPCGYVLKAGNESLTYMTDTGVLVEESFPYMQNPTYLIIESNHDIKMLMKSERPMILKQRILSDHGHLCNEDSAFIAARIIGSNTKEIVLAHLSEECNLPEKALAAYEKVFKYKGLDVNKFNIRCAEQWRSLIGGHDED